MHTALIWEHRAKARFHELAVSAALPILAGPCSITTGMVYGFRADGRLESSLQAAPASLPDLDHARQRSLPSFQGGAPPMITPERRGRASIRSLPARATR